MTAFSLISPEWRYLLSGLLFLASIAELALCLYQHICHIGKKRRVADGALFIVLLLALAYVTAAAGDKSYTAPFPWLVVPLAAALISVHAALGMRRAYRESREKLSPSSIKEALDNLNSGILFSDGTGKTVLINRTMGKLAAVLIGAYPQMLDELRDALLLLPAESRIEKIDDELYRFPDGRVWRFQTVPLHEPELEGFSQTTAQDMTELVEINKQLECDNAALRVAIGRMEKMVERIVDLIPKQEMLSLKIRIHNDIGTSLIALSELVRNGGQEEADAQIRILSNALRYFGRPDAAIPGTFEDARRQAAEMKVELIFEGDAPQNKETEAIIAAAASECVTNCIRHAKGSAVTVTIATRAGICIATITNDGEAPSEPIVEGSGLSSLRKKVESLGGEMHISHTPRFTFVLNLTERKPEV